MANFALLLGFDEQSTNVQAALRAHKIKYTYPRTLISVTKHNRC